MFACCMKWLSDIVALLPKYNSSKILELRSQIADHQKKLQVCGYSNGNTQLVFFRGLVFLIAEF
jgi:hypothetical protein